MEVNVSEQDANCSRLKETGTGNTLCVWTEPVKTNE